MTNFARTPARAAVLHRLALLLLLAAAAALLCSLVPAPAGAVVTEAESVEAGVQPRSTALTAPSPSAPIGTFANNAGNAVVTGKVGIYLVYWDPGAWYHHEWIQHIDQFAQDLAADSGEDGTIFDAVSQYRDRQNAQASDSYVYMGSYHDTQPYPTSGNCSDPEPLEFGQITCLTDAQMRAGLERYIASIGTAKGMSSIYYVLTPPGVTVCLGAASGHCSDYSSSPENSFCSYHAAINPEHAAEGNANTILYAAVPWVANFTGGVWDFQPKGPAAKQAVGCQDGGWSPEGGEHKEALPHVEEPNQEGKDEEGDYSAGLSDVIVNQIAVEQANILTDPLLHSWKNTVNGQEATDECRDVFASTYSPSKLGGSEQTEPETEAATLSNEDMPSTNPDKYYINNILDTGYIQYPRCVGGLGLDARFTAPTPANSGESVTFDGLESTITEIQSAVYGTSGAPTETYASFDWNFGDGTSTSGYAPGAAPCEAPWLSPCAGSISHRYTYGGTYPVTLTVTDAAGHVSSVTHEITVDGPAAPAATPAEGASTPGAAGPGASGGSSGSSPGSSSGGGGGATPGAAPAAPVASTALVSHSLRNALQQGHRRELLGQRAGRGALRSADLTHARPQAEDRRPPSRRAAGRARPRSS